MIIGIVGGMGSYATVDFFKRIIDSFPAEKEWDRPRIIVDNYCTMPSRVRAILYDERKEELCECLASSVKMLLESNADRIILACNTSHVFLPEIYALVPKSVGRIIDIIDSLSLELIERKINSVSLIASEGTIESGIYNRKFESRNIAIEAPTLSQYENLRLFIESIKQNNLTDDIKHEFIDYVNDCTQETVVLGCTELPVLYAECLKSIGNGGGYQFEKKVFDPLQSAINVLRGEIYQELICQKKRKL